MIPDLDKLRWRKSSHSSGQNGACVELACLDAAAWRKSSHSSGQNGECVELACLDAAAWRKSSRSSGQGGNCVELVYASAVRDSKNPAGPVLLLGPAAWRGLLTTAKGAR